MGTRQFKSDLKNGDRLSNSSLTILVTFLFVISSITVSIFDLEVQLDDINMDNSSSNNTIDSNTSNFLATSLGINPTSSLNGIFDSSNNIHLVWRNYSIDDTDSGPALDIDFNGIIHIVVSQYSTNNLGIFLNYAMISSTNTLLIAPTDISSYSSTGLNYIILNPSLDNQDGSVANAADIIIAAPINWNFGIEHDPDISIDSFGAAHITWVSNADSLGILYNTNQIYYAMYAYDNYSSIIDSLIGHTLITQSLSSSGSPSISVNSNNTVTIVWQDTSYSSIEFVAPLDTSGSMNAEWADMCAVFYGGSFASGYQFEGLKPMLEESNITVYETLYALSGNWPSAATSGNCAAAYSTGGSGNQGPRTTSLGLQPNDDSGGIRELTEVVYANGAIDLPQDGGYYSEFWGPASTWACLSWNDTQGNIPGNPPTLLDHHWSPNATKFVIPVSDEGPYGGDPATDSDDTQSILEAHNACVNAGIIPIPLMAAGFGSGSTAVGSHMMDMAQCPNGFQSLNTRTCNGSSLALTDAGGTMYSFPTGSANQAEMQLMVNQLVNLSATSGSTEILLTVLDPYSFFNNPRNNWNLGESGHIVNQSDNTYGEYVGSSLDSSGYGNLVIVDDIRLTSTNEYSINPDVEMDEVGNVHVVWSDGRNNILDINGAKQVHYMQIDLFRNGPLQGTIDLDESITVSDTSLIESNLTYGQNPKLNLDTDDSIYITWFESDSVQQSRLMSIRLQSPQSMPDGNLYLHSNLYTTYSQITTEIISPDSQILNSPITGFNYPDKIILWLELDNCGSSNNGGLENSLASISEVCIYKYSDYSLDIITPLDSNLILVPNEYRNIEMTLFSDFIPSGSDNLLLSYSIKPVFWDILFGHTLTNQEIISLVQGSHVPVTLSIKSPSLYQINSNQSFELEIYFYSLSYSTLILTKTFNIILINDADWDDDDGDGVSDIDDLCQWGLSNWTSSILTDNDGDGCKDSSEDNNDDQDPFLDSVDNCPTGMSWWDDISIDYDQDGCVDSEDVDDDNDGILDFEDLCQVGVSNWSSSILTDYDRDGCEDLTEDNNDDQDPFLDSVDSCPTGMSWWDNISMDYDQDGCIDSEDNDDDNDGWYDTEDNCRQGFIGVMSDLEADYDQDGCINSEDDDDDDDNILDLNDQCPLGLSGIASTIFTDWDADGCIDSEDDDDDDDGIFDIDDTCIKSMKTTSPIIDADLDGCNDLNEDNDLDNDGIISSIDRCEFSQFSTWVSNPKDDQDSDGCRDSSEDSDDDNDGVLDYLDLCEKTHLIQFQSDYDNDGCEDSMEDFDDDNDGIIDIDDNCPRGVLNWISNSETDQDSDGCNDALEDSSLPASFPMKILLGFFVIGVVTIFALTIFQTPRSNLSKRRTSQIITSDHVGDFDLDILDDIANGLDNKLEDIKKQPVITDQLTKVTNNEIINLSLSDLITDIKDVKNPLEWLQMAEILSDSGNLIDAKICRDTAVKLLQEGQ